MGRGEVARWEDGWSVGDERSSLGELGGMGEWAGAEPDSRMRGTMKREVQRLCLLSVWWR